MQRAQGEEGLPGARADKGHSSKVKKVKRKIYAFDLMAGFSAENIDELAAQKKKSCHVLGISREGRNGVLLLLDLTRTGTATGKA